MEAQSTVSNTETGLWPFWIESNEIFCDKAGLQLQLKQNLTYDSENILRIIEKITSQNGHNSIPLSDFWSKAASAYIPAEMLRLILMNMGHSEMLYLLSYRDTNLGYSSTFHWCTHNKKTEILSIIFDCLCEDECFQFLSICGKKLWTPFHLSCLLGDTESLKAMLRHVDEDQRCSLLTIANQNFATPIHTVIHNEHIDILEAIQNFLTHDHWLMTLQLKDSREMTVLQAAIYFDKQSAIAKLKESVSKEEWVRLLSNPLPVLNRRFCNEESYQQYVNRVENLRVAAKIESIILTTDQADRELQIQSIMETESLDVKQIQELSLHSNLYIVPHKQGKSKRYGLVFFSSEGRQGATAEAEDVEQALEASGCYVEKMDWRGALELQHMIDDALSRISSDCSVLIVCIMSHGRRGVLEGGNGNEIPINDVLNQFTQTLPANLPLVMILQACQSLASQMMQPIEGSSEPDAPVPSRGVDPHHDKHIVLRRRHTALLMATVTGGIAYRGAFTGAIADELREADGKKDICSMYISAAADPACRDQCPEFRMTLDKSLILPPALNNIAMVQPAD